MPSCCKYQQSTCTLFPKSALNLLLKSQGDMFIQSACSLNVGQAEKQFLDAVSGQFQKKKMMFPLHASFRSGNNSRAKGSVVFPGIPNVVTAGHVSFPRNVFSTPAIQTMSDNHIQRDRFDTACGCFLFFRFPSTSCLCREKKRDKNRPRKIQGRISGALPKPQQPQKVHLSQRGNARWNRCFENLTLNARQLLFNKIQQSLLMLNELHINTEFHFAEE